MQQQKQMSESSENSARMLVVIACFAIAILVCGIYVYSVWSGKRNARQTESVANIQEELATPAEMPAVPQVPEVVVAPTNAPAETNGAKTLVWSVRPRLVGHHIDEQAMIAEKEKTQSSGTN